MPIYIEQTRRPRPPDRATHDSLDYAESVIVQGWDSLDREILATGLEKVRRYYHSGKYIDRRVGEQNTLSKEVPHTRDAIAVWGKGGRPDRGLDAFATGMAYIWIALDGYVGTATGTGEAKSPFERFCNGWLAVIDPGRPPPTRKYYRKIQKRIV